MMSARKTIAILMALYLVWGFNWVVMRAANMYFSPVLFIIFRFGTGAIVLLSVCAVRKKLIPPRRYWKWIALMGVLVIAGTNLFVQITIDYLGAGLSAVLNYTQSVFTFILAAIFLKESFTLRKSLGVIMSVAGLFILMNISGTGVLWAILLNISSAFLWGVSNIIVKTKLIGCDMAQYTGWQMAFGTVLLILYSLFFPPEICVFTPLSVMTILYNGILASAVCFLLFNYLLTHTEAGKASVSIMAVPAVGVISGIIVFHEPMTLQIFLGMAVLIAGILLVVWQKQYARNA